MTKLFWLAGAGILGTLARYGLQGLVQRHAATIFPWGTMAVNMLGCLLFGLVWALAEERALFSSELRTILLIGFMGAFTTFSSFAFETAQLMRDGEWMLAGANVAAQNVGGIVALFLGIGIARWL